MQATTLDLAPIKHIDEQRFREECFTKAHLLELLYHSVVPKLQSPSEIKTDEKDQKEKQEENKKEIGCFKATIDSIFQYTIFVFCAGFNFLCKIFKSKIFMQLITVPWKIMANILKIRDKSNTVSEIFSSAHDVIEEAESAVQLDTDESPLVEEIAIPSVTELSKTGVIFSPTKGGLNTIQFMTSSATFYLPVIHLNDNSDVVLRNLVAYEACIAPEAMVFTRCTELMNGIIDTEEDVRILREAGILMNRMKSDKEVASMWNGMTTSVKVTKVPIIDRTIEGVNAYYAASWRVKVKETMKKYVYASWPCLTFLAANILIWLSVVETICSMYRCSKWLVAL